MALKIAKKMSKKNIWSLAFFSFIGIQVLFYFIEPRNELAYRKGIFLLNFHRNGRKHETKIQQHQGLEKFCNFTVSDENFEMDKFRKDVYQYILNITDLTKEPFKLLLQCTLKNKETLKTLRLQHSVMTQFTKDESPTLIPPWLRVTYNNVTWNDHRLPVITAFDRGRLGNKLGEYATLFALGKLYNVTVVIHPYMQQQLQKAFPLLSLPNLPKKENFKEWTKISTGSKRIYNYSPLELAASGLFGPKRFIANAYPFEIQLFHSFREEIKREFTFSDLIQQEVAGFYSNISQKMGLRAGHLKNVTLVGYHVRRTDYNKHISMFGGHLPDGQFFQRALQYYRSKFDSVLFIASSDDNEFLRTSLQNEKDVVFVEGKPPETSMAILASCNHSIVTHGSFGFWSGYLAGGEVVYPDQTYAKEYRFSRESYQAAKLNFYTPIKQ